MCVHSTRFPGGSDSRGSACNVGDPGSIPASGRSPGGGPGKPLQYSCLETEEPGRLQSMGSHRVRHVYMCIHTYIFFFRFFSSVAYYKVMSRVPVLCSRSLLVIYYIDVYMLIPNSYFTNLRPSPRSLYSFFNAFLALIDFARLPSGGVEFFKKIFSK